MNRPHLTNISRCRPALGTFIEISLSTELSLCAADSAINSAYRAIALVESLMSEFLDSSDVSRISTALPGQRVRLHPLTATVLRTAKEIHKKSGGVFDVVSCCSRLANKISATMDDLKIEEIDNQSYATPTKRLRLSLNGIAKGFAVDQGIQALLQAGISQAIINAGGDISAIGPSAYRILVRNPLKPGEASAILDLANESVATSAYYNTEIKTQHINCRTSEILNRVSSATVIAKSCMLADALTKIALVSSDDARSTIEDYGAKVYHLT